MTTTNINKKFYLIITNIQYFIPKIIYINKIFLLNIKLMILIIMMMIF